MTCINLHVNFALVMTLYTNYIFHKVNCHLHFSTLMYGPYKSSKTFCKIE